MYYLAPYILYVHLTNICKKDYKSTFHDIFCIADHIIAFLVTAPFLFYAALLEGIHPFSLQTKKNLEKNLSTFTLVLEAKRSRTGKKICLLVG